ncbi:expressed unknown protein [Seminavis robusta]|uniref:Uncharacterized protein n=1 Tax=Seminavis robusta TaxID=568900 RepID=A0A9N8HDS3_9STRA|nr:expressed unknown protein [Seminavis robusta]|eukprot:Sro355_g125120.1 n/a (237) ;mRNA; r:41926-42751
MEQRVVQVVIDEDSRECPSQTVGEIGRDDFYRAGANERRGSGHLQTQHMVHYKPMFHRVTGLKDRHSDHQSKAFRERRDCNSFDSHDSDDDESVVLQHAMAACNNHYTKPYNSPTKVEEAVVVQIGDSGKGTPGNNTMIPNKRKTPSPAMGVEPAPVSVVPLCGESMDMDDEEKTNNEQDEQSYDSDDNSLPSLSRRLSLTPVSRRLALQFDSISIYDKKPSRSKRRKTSDTSLQC